MLWGLIRPDALGQPEAGAAHLGTIPWVSAVAADLRICDGEGFQGH